MESPQISSTNSLNKEDKSTSIGQPDTLEKSPSSSFGFLCQNVRFLNQPICTLVGDQNKVDYRQQFVAQNVSLVATNTSDKKPKPKYAIDSTQRQDFPNFSEMRPERPIRVPQQPAQGIVPGVSSISDTKKREKISYEHSYDSRTENNYPPRGKRLGTFV